MRKLDANFSDERALKQLRNNPDRYFHIMTEGWYVYTREGIRGPFVDKPLAKGYLQRFIEGEDNREDPSAGWRL